MKRFISLLGKILLRLVVLTIFLCNYFVLFLYTSISLFSEYNFVVDIEQPAWLKAGLIVLLPALLLLAVILYWPEKKKNTAIPTRRRFYRRIFTAVSVLFFLFLVIDAKEPEYRYSIKELTTEDPVVRESTVLLNELYYGKDEIPDIRFIKESNGYAAIEKYTGEIRDAWRNIAAQREIVDRLASYDTILHEVEEFDFTLREIYIRRVALIYHCNSLLLARSGDIEKAVGNLCLFQIVTRKGLQGSVNLIQKMLWIYICGENLRTAYQLAYEYPLDEKLLQRLAAAFAPLAMEEVSLHKPWIGEYISLKEQVNLSFLQTMEAKIYEPEHNSKAYALAGLLPESVVNCLYRLTLQKNRTSRQIAAFWEPIIEKSHESVMGVDAVVIEDIYPSLPIRNLGGWYFHQPPYFAGYTKRMVKLKVQGDLFSRYLYQQLKIGAYIPSYYINEKTLITEDRKKLVSAGEDMKFGSEDDVKLEVYY